MICDHPLLRPLAERLDHCLSLLALGGEDIFHTDGRLRMNAALNDALVLQFAQSCGLRAAACLVLSIVVALTLLRSVATPLPQTMAPLGVVQLASIFRVSDVLA